MRNIHFLSKDKFVHEKTIHKGEKQMYCEVEGCDYFTFLRKAMRAHMRRGMHGKRTKWGRPLLDH